jgi:preprotein translocase subunit YajC
LAASRKPADRRKYEAFMLISPAYAQGMPTNMLAPDSPIWMIVILFVIMYFLVFRPQQKRAKQHQEMVKNVRRGDTVITNGGLVGKVTKLLDDDQLEVEIADGVRVRQLRGMVADVRAKGEPVKDESASG